MGVECPDAYSRELDNTGLNETQGKNSGVDLNGIKSKSMR